MDDATNAIAQTCAMAREFVDPIEEAARGYKAKLTAAGWSAEAAEKIALDYFDYVMQTLRGSLS